MLYAIGEIILFLILSAVVGGLIGYVVTRSRSRRDLEQRIEHTHRTHGAELSKIRARLDGRNVEIVTLNDELADTRGRLRSMESELESGAAVSEESRDGIERAAREMKEARQAAAASAEWANTSETQLGAARARVAELEEVLTGRVDRIAELEEALQDRTDRVDALLEEQADSRSVATVEAGIDPRSDVSELESQLAAKDQEIRVLKERAGQPTQLTIDVPDDPGQLSTEDARAQVASIAVRTQAGADPINDDLKLIKGIGPKIDGLLKEMGITSFRQVANFTAADVRVVSVALKSFPDRIERDDWMKSARSLHTKHHGESLP